MCILQWMFELTGVYAKKSKILVQKRFSSGEYSNTFSSCTVLSVLRRGYCFGDLIWEENQFPPTFHHHQSRSVGCLSICLSLCQSQDWNVLRIVLYDYDTNIATPAPFVCTAGVSSRVNQLFLFKLQCTRHQCGVVWFQHFIFLFPTVYQMNVLFWAIIILQLYVKST